MFYVLRKARKLCLPIDVLLQLFVAMVAPIMLYDSEVWGYEDCINVIETLHLEFCKFVMRVKKKLRQTVLFMGNLVKCLYVYSC